MGFRVRNMETRQVVPGIPTPRLIEAGDAEAFFQPGDIKSGGVWYLHEPGTMHVSKDGTYTRVRVEHTEDWRVDVQVKVLAEDKSRYDDEYDDYFIVDAASEQEAFRLAEKAAFEDVENRYGEEYGGVEVITIRARQGVSI